MEAHKKEFSDKNTKILEEENAEYEEHDYLEEGHIEEYVDRENLSQGLVPEPLSNYHNLNFLGKL